MFRWSIELRSVDLWDSMFSVRYHRQSGMIRERASRPTSPKFGVSQKKPEMRVMYGSGVLCALSIPLAKSKASVSVPVSEELLVVSILFVCREAQCVCIHSLEVVISS